MEVRPRGDFPLAALFSRPFAMYGRAAGYTAAAAIRERHRAPASGGMPFSRAAIQSRTYRANGLRRRCGGCGAAVSPAPPEKGKNGLYKKEEAGQAHMAPVRLPAYIESPLCVIQHPYPIAVLQGACSCCSARGRLPVRHRTTPGLPPGTVSLPMRNAPPL